MIIIKKFVNKKTIILFFILLISIFLLWYHYPIEKVINVKACSLDGNVADVSINIKYYRSILKPTYVTGIIIFNGNEYVDLKGKGTDPYKDKKFFENIKLKFNGFTHFYFVNSSLPAPIFMHDAILLLKNAYNSDKFSFLLTKNTIEHEYGLVYYAPATTMEEAYDIYNFLYPNLNNKN